MNWTKIKEYILPRLKNPAWVIGIIGAGALLAQALGFDAATVSGAEGYIINVVNALFGIAAAIGITVETSTPTLKDLKVESLKNQK